MNIAIAGYGMEGKVSVAYWQNKGNRITILDEKDIQDIPPRGVSLVTGSTALDALDDYDMVIRTASLSPHKLLTAHRVWSATNEFFAECPAPIIGVTGTKGKGTTASMIASILQAAEKTVHTVGNIGVPALEALPSIRSSDVVVFELSSFQLWDIERSPHIAVVLMIAPDHLDVHLNMDEYVRAKSRIALHQTHHDTVLYHPENKLSQVVALNGRGRKIRFAIPDDGGVFVRSNTFFVHDTPLCSTNVVQVVGEHNIDNACAAISAVRAFDATITTTAIEQGLRSFTGLPHRLKLIRELDGVRYYDDNYSSAPMATIAAMRSFTEPEVLIVGGYDKQVAFHELAKAIAEQPNIQRIILIGQTQHKIAAALDTVGLTDLYECCDDTNMSVIVERAQQIAQPGSVVVMSPACASFDMFTNFSERGDEFIRSVDGLLHG